MLALSLLPCDVERLLGVGLHCSKAASDIGDALTCQRHLGVQLLQARQGCEERPRASADLIDDLDLNEIQIVRELTLRRVYTRDTLVPTHKRESE